MQEKVEKAMPITADLTARKIVKNIGEGIKKGRSSKREYRKYVTEPAKYEEF